MSLWHDESTHLWHHVAAAAKVLQFGVITRTVSLRYHPPMSLLRQLSG